MDIILLYPTPLSPDETRLWDRRELKNDWKFRVECSYVSNTYILVMNLYHTDKDLVKNPP
jgi:hypothetical protein